MGSTCRPLGDIDYCATVTLVIYKCPECGERGMFTVVIGMPEEEYELVELPCGCRIGLGTLDAVSLFYA